MNNESNEGNCKCNVKGTVVSTYNSHVRCLCYYDDFWGNFATFSLDLRTFGASAATLIGK